MGASVPSTLPVQFGDRIPYITHSSGAYRSQLGAIVRLRGELDESRFHRSLRLLLDAEPVLGCRFDPEGRRPVWRRVDPIESERVLRVSDSARPVADAHQFLAEPLDPAVGPQASGALFRSPEGDTLVLKITHVALDGGGLKEALYQLAGIYGKLATRPDWLPSPNVDGVRAARGEGGLVAKINALRRSSLTFPESDWPTPDTGEPCPGRYSTSTVDRETLSAAAGRATPLNATVNDVVVAAFLRNLWRMLGPAPGSRTPVQLTVDLRKHLPSGTPTALSNMSALWSIDVLPVEDEDFEGTLSRVVEQTREWKRSGAGKTEATAMPIVNALMARQSMEQTMKFLTRQAPGVEDLWLPTLTNIGVIDAAQLDFGNEHDVEDAWLLGPLFPQLVTVLVSTFRGTLHLVCGTEFASLNGHPVMDVTSGTAGEIVGWAAGAGGCSG